ncbi:bacteriohemerythrin [Quatrionicoccus australiensis]|uniref:bacteriohemerythrin n=1 Tax=Quatrionicoccus australiensis TaxID=138118 RepID=UPI001CFA4C32|nr:bacteriohemerythrin [Quatrionicoccus australiensis]MCB4358229.1 bacteriohemerythrin [Quatrionicoccus australiensis]
MDKDQEILAISRLVFELTKLGGADVDLDHMLAKLFDLLISLPGIRVEARSAILLNNSRGGLTQVAQFGLPPVWENSALSRADPYAGQGDVGQAFVTAASRFHPYQSVAAPDAAACFVLPLRNQGKPLGRVLLFIDPEWQADAVESEFMTDLAGALSVLVSRCIINETLRVREVELEEARTDAIRRLGAASEYRDNETGMHIMRMTHFSTSIAKAMGLPQEMRDLLAVCAPMHDVGKIGIPDAILLKPGRLSTDEFTIMKTHTEIGSRLLTGTDTLIQTAKEIAASHHEHWDGNGYPEGLKGEEIPLLARICAVADVFDALTSARPYKNPWPVEEAAAWVRQQAGSHFDPQVVVAFDVAMPEILRIRQLYRDEIIDPNQVLDLPVVPSTQSDWVRWEGSLSVGIDVIDEHHRYLFDLTNDLFEIVSQKRGASEVARVLKALSQYAQVHFRAEERMMAHYGYAAIAVQQHQHHAFEDRLQGFYEELHNNPLTAQFEVLIYLRNWLVRHIVQEDAGLYELVKV